MSINSLTINLAEAASCIASCGAYNTVILEGEPGIGKSALLPIVGKLLGIPKENQIYFDAQRFDMGDFAIPVPDLKARIVTFMINSMFTCGEGNPLLIMADEIGKASKAVQNIVMTMMHEYRIGDYHLPEGTVIFGTTNLSSDGVGDSMQAHFTNRVSMMEVRKPDSEQWLGWAVNNGIAPELCAWISEYPHALASYRDEGGSTAQKVSDNPYIFDPRKAQGAFVSPRSLEKASNIINKRAALTNNALITMLSGTIGESAARDMQAYLDVADSLPTWDAIIAKPKDIDVPSNPIAACILALAAVMRVDTKNCSAWMTYLERLPSEVQFMFATNAINSKKAAGIITRNKTFTAWARANAWAA